MGPMTHDTSTGCCNAQAHSISSPSHLEEGSDEVSMADEILESDLECECEGECEDESEGEDDEDDLSFVSLANIQKMLPVLPNAASITDTGGEKCTQGRHDSDGSLDLESLLTMEIKVAVEKQSKKNNYDSSKEKSWSLSSILSPRNTSMHHHPYVRHQRMNSKDTLNLGHHKSSSQTSATFLHSTTSSFPSVASAGGNCAVHSNREGRNDSNSTKNPTRLTQGENHNASLNALTNVSSSTFSRRRPPSRTDCAKTSWTGRKRLSGNSFKTGIQSDTCNGNSNSSNNKSTSSRREEDRIRRRKGDGSIAASKISQQSPRRSLAIGPAISTSKYARRPRPSPDTRNLNRLMAVKGQKRVLINEILSRTAMKKCPSDASTATSQSRQQRRRGRSSSVQRQRRAMAASRSSTPSGTTSIKTRELSPYHPSRKKRWMDAKNCNRHQSPHPSDRYPSPMTTEAHSRTNSPTRKYLLSKSPQRIHRSQSPSRRDSQNKSPAIFSVVNSNSIEGVVANNHFLRQQRISMDYEVKMHRKEKQRRRYRSESPNASRNLGRHDPKSSIFTRMDRGRAHRPINESHSAKCNMKKIKALSMPQGNRRRLYSQQRHLSNSSVTTVDRARPEA